MSLPAKTVSCTDLSADAYRHRARGGATPDSGVGAPCTTTLAPSSCLAFASVRGHESAAALPVDPLPHAPIARAAIPAATAAADVRIERRRNSGLRGGAGLVAVAGLLGRPVGRLAGGTGGRLAGRR